MSDKILVINPNSTAAVTRGIDEACAPLRMHGAPAIECMTLKEGPPGIETQQHVDGVIPHLTRVVKETQDGYAAFTVSESQVGRVRHYIQNQREHHDDDADDQQHFDQREAALLSANLQPVSAHEPPHFKTAAIAAAPAAVD